MKCKRQSIRFGFTLVEVLVVVTIIALIAALLFPVFERARAQARKATCQSNLKQIGLAFQQYTQDYDGKLPPSKAGSHLTAEGYMVTGIREYALTRLMPYVKNAQIFRCPEDTLVKGGAMVTGDSTYARISYVPVGKNENPGGGSPARWGLFDGPGVISGSGTPVGVSIAEVVAPAETISLAECVSTPPGYNALPHVERGDATPSSGLSFFAGDFLSASHNGGANYLFADGHVKWFKRGNGNEELNGGRAGADITVNGVNYYYFWRSGVTGK